MSQRRLPKLLMIVLLLVLSFTLVSGCLEEEKQSSNVNQNKATNESPKTAKVKEEPQAGQKSQPVTIIVYFSDSDAQYLVPEKREVTGASRVEELAAVAMRELMAGPKMKTNYKTIPDGTKLISLDVRDKVANANFSKELSENHWGGSTGELLTIGSIVDSLTEFPEIQKVQILIDGKTTQTLAGHADISQPLARNEELLKK